MVDRSVLFPNPSSFVNPEREDEPDFFQDLNLDQIFKTLAASKAEYRLLPLYQASFPRVELIHYRQRVAQDLEKPDVYSLVKRFETGMRSVREFLAQSEKRYNTYQKESWFLDAVERYCSTVREFSSGMAKTQYASAGLRNMVEYLGRYVQSEYFLTLEQEIQGIKEALATIHYAVLLSGGTVRVRKYEDEIDYTADVEASFKKFQTREGKSYLISFVESADMNSVEEKILLAVARLYPEIFNHLNSFYTVNQVFQDETITTFDREIQFYVAYLDYIQEFKQKGYPFCYPEILENNKNIEATATFDLALAHRLSNLAFLLNIPPQFSILPSRRWKCLSGCFTNYGPWRKKIFPSFNPKVLKTFFPCL